MTQTKYPQNSVPQEQVKFWNGLSHEYMDISQNQDLTRNEATVGYNSL